MRGSREMRRYQREGEKRIEFQIFAMRKISSHELARTRVVDWPCERSWSDCLSIDHRSFEPWLDTDQAEQRKSEGKMKSEQRSKISEWLFLNDNSQWNHSARALIPHRQVCLSTHLLQSSQSQVIHWHPNWTSPIVLSFSKVLVFGRERSDTEIGPKMIWIRQ